MFDEEGVRFRAHEPADFVADARETYGLEAPDALDFSNGANIAAAMLMQRPEALARAALLRAMVPLQDASKTDLTGNRVLMVSGAMASIVSTENSARLAASLASSGAGVQHGTLPTGRGLSQTDLQLLLKWFE